MSYRLGNPQKNCGFSMHGYWIWDPSVIRGDDGVFHMFASRWPTWLPMHPGWLVRSEVIRATSKNIEGPYNFQEVVLPPRGAAFWDGRATHNPRILKYGDTFLLYYIGMTHPFPDIKQGEMLNSKDQRCEVAHASKRIGLATSKSLIGPWIRNDEPILNTKPNTFHSYLTSNPAPCLDKDGSVSMIFKARAYDGETCGPMTIGLARAPHYSGPYEVVSKEPLFSPTKMGEIEDPFIWKSEKGFELIAKDMWGTLCGEHHGGVYAQSLDGLDWKLANPPLFYSRHIQWDDGERQTLGSFERAFIYFEEGKPTYLFGATADGPGGFTKASCTWNLGIPILTT